jgi:hypothetical protein
VQRRTTRRNSAEITAGVKKAAYDLYFIDKSIESRSATGAAE